MVYSLLLKWGCFFLCRTNPITWDGQELLLIPVALEDDRDVYGGLYSGESDEEDIYL